VLRQIAVVRPGQREGALDVQQAAGAPRTCGAAAGRSRRSRDRRRAGSPPARRSPQASCCGSGHLQASSGNLSGGERRSVVTLPKHHTRPQSRSSNAVGSFAP
jgi:hypothetical protein